MLVGVGHGKAAGDQRSALAAEDADGLAQVVEFLCALGIAAKHAGDTSAAQLHAGQFEVQRVEPL